jgi:hypothetical protein
MEVMGGLDGGRVDVVFQLRQTSYTAREQRWIDNGDSQDDEC